MPLPKKSFFTSAESQEEQEEEVVPVDKIAVLCVGGKASECIKKLSDANLTSEPEFKKDIGKVETDEVNFLLLDGNALLSDPTNPAFFNSPANSPVNKYPVILICPADAADLKKHKGLSHFNNDKIIRVMTDDRKIHLDAESLIGLPTPETRIQILKKLYHEVNVQRESNTASQKNSR